MSQEEPPPDDDQSDGPWGVCQPPKRPPWIMVVRGLRAIMGAAGSGKIIAGQGACVGSSDTHP